MLFGGYRYLIGIDPGRTTGVAVWDRKQERFTYMDSMSFWDLIEYLRGCMEDSATFAVRVEDPNKNKPLFFKKGSNTKRAQIKIAQNVGMNKNTATLIIHFLERHKIKYENPRPGKRSHTKLSEEKFQQITGQEGGNEHIRDAAMLVYGY